MQQTKSERRGDQSEPGDGCIFGGFRKEFTPAHGGLHPYSCEPDDGLRSSNLWRPQYLAMMVLESWCDFKSHFPLLCSSTTISFGVL